MNAASLWELLPKKLAIFFFLLPVLFPSKYTENVFAECGRVPRRSGGHSSHSFSRGGGSLSDDGRDRYEKNTFKRGGRIFSEDDSSKERYGKDSSGRRRGVSSSSSLWSNYMMKFDIPKVHGSGVYADLGGSATVGTQTYRMPVGRCPVMGKVIELQNGGFFLEPISGASHRERGLGFPKTERVSIKTRDGKGPFSLSPVSTSELRSWGYKNGDDLANCAEYARNVVPASSPQSTYRYPFVYDSAAKMCHLLYTAMQYNEGARYCDADGEIDAGLSSLACMSPYKSEEDSDLYYGSSRVPPNWRDICPMNPVRDAIYGKWNGASCRAMLPVYELHADSFGECAQMLFERSPSDVRIAARGSNIPEQELIKKKFQEKDFQEVVRLLFEPLILSSLTLSGGAGCNWANYDPATSLCSILDEVPTCLIISAGKYALNSIGSPLEADAEPYPCHIDTLGFVDPQEYSRRKGDNVPGEVTTALSKEVLGCEKHINMVRSWSCGYYYECSDRKVFSILEVSLISGGVVLLFCVAFWIFRRMYCSRTCKKPKSRDSEHLLEKYEYEDSCSAKTRRDEQLEPDAYVWGETDTRPSDLTPVRLSRLE